MNYQAPEYAVFSSKSRILKQKHDLTIYVRQRTEPLAEKQEDVNCRMANVEQGAHNVEQGAQLTSLWMNPT